MDWPYEEGGVGVSGGRHVVDAADEREPREHRERREWVRSATG